MHRREQCWKRWKALSGLGVLLLHFTAAAQAPSPVQGCIQKALQLYDGFQYEAALEKLGCSRLHTLTEEEHVSILLYKGIFLALLVRREEASAAFEEALRLRPAASLPLPDVPPKVSIQFEAIRAALLVAKPDPEKSSAEPGAPFKPRSPSPPKSPLAQPSATRLPEGAALAEERLDPPPVGPHATDQVGDSPPSVAAEIPERRALGPRVLVPASAGGALVIAGGVFWGLARKEHSRLASDDPGLTQLSEVASSASRGRTYQTLGFSLASAGLLGLSLAAGLYGVGEFGMPDGLSMGTTGTHVVIHGRW